MSEALACPGDCTLDIRHYCEQLGTFIQIFKMAKIVDVGRDVHRIPGRAPHTRRHAGDLAGYLREREGDDTVEV